MGVAEGLIIGGTALGLFGSYKSYDATKRQNADLSANALAQGRMLNMQYGMQAAMSASQARFHSMQADALRGQADFAKKHALTLASYETTKAAAEQQKHERDIERAAKLRRLTVGAGLVAYAGNGVLLEARPDSAAARWEQDEMADLAVEMVMMRHETDKEVWGYLKNAESIKLQGEQDAYAMRLQSLSADMDAANAGMQSGLASLNAASALTEAWNAASAYRSQTKAARYAMYGDLARNVTGLGSLLYRPTPG